MPTDTETPTSPSVETPTQPPAEEPQLGTPSAAAPAAAEPPAEQGTEPPADEEQREALAEGWQEHPDVTAWAKERDDASYRKAQSEFDQRSERERLQDEARHTQALDKAVKQAQSSTAIDHIQKAAMAVIAEAKRDPEQGAISFKELLAENEPWAQIYGSGLVERGKNEGIGAGLTQAMELVKSALPDALQAAFDEEFNLTILRNQARKIELEPAVGHLYETAFKLIREAAEKELEPMVRSRLEQESRAGERNGKEPPPKLSGRAKGGSTNDSDEARLQRLAYGRDADGATPTLADREWLAQRN